MKSKKPKVQSQKREVKSQKAKAPAELFTFDFWLPAFCF
jgi:hypothetical protein